MGMWTGGLVDSKKNQSYDILKKIIRFFANFKIIYYLCTRNQKQNDSNFRRTISGEPVY